jgi:F-box-like
VLTSWAGHAAINILPDDILLLIFRFDRALCLDGLGEVGQLGHMPNWRWHRLVHVCQRWRSVVFGSPNFLDLRLDCGPTTRVELIGIWPPFPIVMRTWDLWPMPKDYDFDGALVHPNRVCQIYLCYLTRLQLQRLVSAMQVQFPALTHLMLGLVDDGYPAPELPDGFLGGSAPRLKSLELFAIGFPALPKLLLSATGLVHLTLRYTPLSRYVLPESIITGLAVLANLKSLIIVFFPVPSPPEPETRRLPPPTRIVLPALTRFEFQGLSEYVEDLVARIDTPLLDSIDISIFHQLTFDIPQLTQLMRRTTRFQALDETHVDFFFNVNFNHCVAQIETQLSTKTLDDKSTLTILYRESDGLLLSLAQVFTSFIPSIYMVEHLYLYGRPQWQDDAEGIQWLEFFRPFTAVKNLHILQYFARFFALALQDLVRDRAADVLPALESILLEDADPVSEAIGPFVAARQLSGHPVAVSRWNRDP